MRIEPSKAVSQRSSLVVAFADVPETSLTPARFPSGGSARIAYGCDSSMRAASLQPDYRSKPHRHDAEQLSYVVQGELHVFVDDGGFVAKEGDVFRIPHNAVHWLRVHGADPCVLLEIHTPALIGDPCVFDTAVALLRGAEALCQVRSVGSQWLTDVHPVHAERIGIELDALRVCLADVPETNLVPAKYLSGGSIGAQIVYGRESSVMVATRQPGYHSKPHRHDAEQLNYVLQGELYVFVDVGGFLAKEGDVFRVPRNAIHWSWVQGTKPCVLLESHSPGLIGDPGVTDTAVALLRASERNDGVQSVGSQWPHDVDQGCVERMVMGPH